jgi:hypothetical protein
MSLYLFTQLFVAQMALLQEEALRFLYVAYVFHITLAYILKHLTGNEQTELMSFDDESFQGYD